MKFFTEKNYTLETLRKKYRELTKKLHPDCGGNAKDFQEMQSEYEKIFSNLKNNSAFNATTEAEKTKYNTEFNWKNDKLLREMIEKIITFESITIEICGIWLWLTGNTFPYKDQLKDLGFLWSKTKKAWYWKPYETFYRRGNKTLSQIRLEYGSEQVSTEKREKLA